MATDKARSVHYLVVGQSYGAEGYTYEGAHYAFSLALRAAFAASAAAINSHTGLTVASGDFVQQRNRAVDGSAILARNAGSPGYWVENGGAAAGPLLTTALGAIAAYPTMPYVVVYSHGEQDASAAASAADVVDLDTAVAYLIGQIRATLYSSSPTSRPVFVDMLGPRYGADEMMEYEVRDKLLAAIAAGTNIYRGAEKYALRLDNTTHPTEASYQQMGAWTGRKVAQWLVDGTELRGPQIGAASKSGSTITIPITVPSGKTLVKPAAPLFFGAFDAGGARLSLSGWSWSGNTLTVTASGTPAKLRYPCPLVVGETFDTTNIIRLSDPSPTLYSGEIGFPLESVSTITL